ncbi:methyltransferase domain-containing protein [Mycolicibacterium cosmeticum]|uniref:Phospholipid N-methyltransferase n=1 Tax=Mycolicibacterium cosmeticum TaxID=258533 RepID=W9ANF2_MYCCO|nr:methyltransferase domain-containing protein [Mycolicibacterium cosmeticum]CDO07003.1 Phospholipid N-methyltransferase [Mycolicibacterium cosmeticum]
MWRCPACGGNDGHQTHRLGVLDAATNFVRPWVDAARHDELVACIGTLWGTDDVRLMRCDRCGLRSANPFVAGDAEFYALAYGRRSFHPYPASRWEYQLTRDVITATSGSVLEIGAGDGAFQRSVIAEGVDPARLYATEFSAEARKALHDLGVTVSARDFRDQPIAGHAVVCGHQVFEHLDGIAESFDAFDRLTAPDGIVVVSVPNGAHVERTETAGGLVDMPPNHISTWGRTSFDAAARRHGWKLIAYHEEPVSRARAAKELAISRSFQARARHGSFPSLAERWSPTPRARYMATAAAAAAKLPRAYLAAAEPHGGSVWVAMRRACR